MHSGFSPESFPDSSADNPSGQSLVLPRLVVSSISGGGGKTLLSLGLARALAQNGHAVLPFKKGPDYIDAAWLAAAAGRPATNLDPFFLNGDRLRAQMGHAACTLLADSERPRALAVIEGNRGLFDGLDLDGSCSTSALARELRVPVVLTINVTKMTRTVAALLQGLEHFEQGVHFAGVVLNRTGSARHASYVRQSIERYTDFTVLGELPRLKTNLLPERHMGLASLRGDELADSARSALEELASFIRDHVDLERIVRAAKAAPALSCGPFWQPPKRSPEYRPCIGYVRDACLWFYYRENLEALERAGGRLVRLSLSDPAWPWEGENGLDALYLGGGFPEDFLDLLDDNPRLQEIAHFSAQGFPVYAECGGLMLLSRSVRRAQRCTRMAGVLPLDIEFCPRPQGLGYVRGTIAHPNPFYAQGTTLIGHEFHYSRVLNASVGEAAVLKLERGMGLGEGRDGLVAGNTWGSYTHIFAPAAPGWAEGLCRLATEWHTRHTA